MTSDGLRISPTAQYTSYVWLRNGLSHPALASRQGRLYYLAFWPLNQLWEGLGSRPGLEKSLLSRHQTIDRLLTAAIDAGEVGQVVEIAAGFSARGLRLARRFPRLTYVEGDLAPIASAKRARLEAGGLRLPNHHVRAIDALVESGPDSLDDASASLDPNQGIAVVTEGLIGYLEPAAVAGLWRRIAGVLARFPRGLYLSDAYLAEALHGHGSVAARGFRFMLQAFVRGRTYTQATNAAEAEAALNAAGFARATLHAPDGNAFVRIVEARTST